MNCTRTIQENGQVTLPVEWRGKFGLKKGDEVIFEETEQGLIVSPRRALLARLLDEIAQDLQEKGVTLEELMRNGRKIRTDILKENTVSMSDPAMTSAFIAADVLFAAVLFARAYVRYSRFRLTMTSHCSACGGYRGSQT